MIKKLSFWFHCITLAFEADLDLGREEQELRSHSFAELSQAESKASMRQTQGTREADDHFVRYFTIHSLHYKESPEIDSEAITVTSHNPIASLIIASNDSVDDRWVVQTRILRLLLISSTDLSTIDEVSNEVLSLQSEQLVINLDKVEEEGEGKGK